MKIGLIGLGRMGGNMRDRLQDHGIEVVGYDHNPDISDVASLSELVAQLPTPRIVWIMVPSQFVATTVSELASLLTANDIVIDGGNSRWTQDTINADLLAKTGINYLDCGVSGGVWGKTEGYALMVGGDPKVVATCQPIFDALKPAGEFGFVHAGGIGAGHYTKMVHNGIEYAIMQAYAEGYELLAAAPEVTDVPAVFDSWRSGTVIRSWLLDLCSRALAEDPQLAAIKGWADDSGEGRWTVESAIDLAVPTPAIAASLFARFSSRQDDSPAMKLIAAMRNQFGGHAIHPDN